MSERNMDEVEQTHEVTFKNKKDSHQKKSAKTDRQNDDEEPNKNVRNEVTNSSTRKTQNKRNHDVIKESKNTLESPNKKLKQKTIYSMFIKETKLEGHDNQLKIKSKDHDKPKIKSAISRKISRENSFKQKTNENQSVLQSPNEKWKYRRIDDLFTKEVKIEQKDNQQKIRSNEHDKILETPKNNYKLKKLNELQKSNRKSRYKRIDEMFSKEIKLEQKQIVDMSVEEIKLGWKQNQEILENAKKILELADIFEKQLMEDAEREKENKKQELLAEEERKKFVLKDCKHYSAEELTDMFTKDFNWIEGIVKGETYNERHEMFIKQKDGQFAPHNLMYNVSCQVFTYDQKAHIVSLFRKTYDNGNIYKNGGYYWKVLLPEYCLKIFMETYNMNRVEALEYLNNIPLPPEED